jgi:site-specific recombinase XerD
MDTRAVSRINYLVAIGNLFSYGVKHDYCDGNPANLVDRPARESGDIHFLSVEQVVALLLHAEEYELVSYVALGVLAGPRPEKELRVLDWSKLSLSERTIRIDASLAKTRQHRVIEIGDALVAYLTPYAKRRGPVVDMDTREFRQRWEACRKDAGVVPWPHDVMRLACVPRPSVSASSHPGSSEPPF